MASMDNTGDPSDLEHQRPYTRSKEMCSLRKLNQNTNKFMENFNPETSARERRKLHRKLTTTNPKKSVGAVYDEYGTHIASGKDACDCLFNDCPGCFFPCPKCHSTKCGNECRVNRKYVYEQVDFEGCDITMKSSLVNNKK